MKGYGKKLTPHGIVGSAIIHSLPMKNKYNYIHKHIQNKLNRRMSKEEVHSFINKHKHKDIHVKHIFGPRWHIDNNSILGFIDKAINHRKKGRGSQQGSGFFSSLKHIATKSLKTLKKFVKGETKFKPHNLMKIVVTAADVVKFGASLIPDPRAQAIAKGADIVSKISKKAGTELKKSGRGCQKGSGILPKKWQRWIRTHGRKAKKSIRQAKKPMMAVGALAGAALGLAVYLKSHPEKMEHAKELANASSSTGSQSYNYSKPKPITPVIDTGTSQVLDTAGRGLKLGGTGFMDRINKNYRTCPDGRRVPARMLCPPPPYTGEDYFKFTRKGSGLHLAGTGKVRRKKGMVVGTKAQVWNSSSHHKITSGGLMKKDLMKNKKGKIISKKMHAKGKALQKYR